VKRNKAEPASPGVSRRELMKLGAAAGISVWLAPLYSKAYAALFEDKLLTPIHWTAS